MIRALLLAGLLAAPAAADPAAEAHAAAEELRVAGLAFAEAERSPDRVRALTDTVRAYERGLAVLRDALRDAALRERALRERFAAEGKTLGQFLAALQAMSRAPEATVLLHPAGALDTARASMLMAAVTSAVVTRRSRSASARSSCPSMPSVPLMTARPSFSSSTSGSIPAHARAFAASVS